MQKRPRSRSLGLASRQVLRSTQRIDALEWEEFEVVVLVELAALEVLERQTCSAAQCQGVDGELYVRVSLLPRLRLVVEDVEKAVADLQEVDVAGDAVAREVQGKACLAEVIKIIGCEVHGHFHRDRDGVVDEHEALQRFMPLLVRGRRGEDESGQLGGVIYFSYDGRSDGCRKRGGAVCFFLKKAVGEMVVNAVEVCADGSQMLMRVRGEEKLGFGAVLLETIHLPMFEFESSYDVLRCKEFLCSRAESRICCNLLVGGEP